MLRTEGIVLKEMRYRDTSKILNIYTKKYGKVSVMARGAYRPRSQIIANTQPFSYNEYGLYKGRNFYYLNNADIIDSFYSIRERMERVVFGSYMLELIEKSLPMEQEQEKLFMLLKKGLEVLSSLDEDFLKFIIAYELKFISFLGYKPYIDKCVFCGNANFTNIRFSISEGGIICSNCFINDQLGLYINKEIHSAMHGLLYIPLDKIGDISVSEQSLNRLHEIIVEYILYNIDRKYFNSLALMKTLK